MITYIILKGHDVLGREIATIVDAFKESGVVSIRFDATVLGVGSGICFYSIEAGSFRGQKKMMLLK